MILITPKEKRIKYLNYDKKFNTLDKLYFDLAVTIILSCKSFLFLIFY